MSETQEDWEARFEAHLDTPEGQRAERRIWNEAQRHAVELGIERVKAGEPVGDWHEDHSLRYGELIAAYLAEHVGDTEN